MLSKVRVKHLLSHTSGLGSYFTPEWDRQSRALWRSVDDWMPLIKDETLQFEPGTRWSYSNTGMLVLGKVIEAASGQDYFTYVREHVAKPAGMTSTDAYELDRVNKNLAVGYEREGEDANGVDLPEQHLPARHPRRAGGRRLLDRGDLTRFAEALKTGKLVSQASVRTAHDAEAGAIVAGVRLRIRCRGGREGRRAQRRFQWHQLAARHLRRRGLHAGGDVELRRRRAAGRREGAVADPGGAGADGVAVEAGGPVTATLHTFRVEETSVANAE